MAIRLSGLNSGLDTEAIVSAMVSAYSTKKDKYVKAQTKLGWKQDAYKAINTKVYGLYKDINSLRFSSAYSLKKTTVSDSTKANVSASGSAINGSQTLGVAQLAKAGYLTGGQLKSGTKGTTKLSDIDGFTEGKINVNGKDIELKGSMTVDQVVEKLNGAGVKASFDETNRRIFISSKDSGKDNDFTITGSNSNGNTALSALGLLTKPAEGSASYIAASKLAAYAGKTDEELQEYLDALNSAHDTLSTIPAAKSYAEAYKLVKDYENGSNSEAIGKLEDLLDKGASEYAYYDSENDMYYKYVKEGVDEDGNKTYLYYNETDEDGNPSGETSGEVANPLMKYADRRKELAFEAGLITREGEPGNYTYKDPNGDYAKFVAARATIGEFESKDANAETVSEVQTAYSGGTIDDLISGYADSISTARGKLSEYADIDAYRSDTVSELRARIQAASDILSGAGTSAGATRVDGQNAVIYLNGARFEGASNKFSINGLTINATGVTGTESGDEGNKVFSGDEVTITTATDVDGIYDKVKDFLGKYNEVVNALSSLYNADSSKGYEPLTDAEKEELTDTQVEKWEQKIKDSLLRRDQTIGNIMSVMSNAMAKNYEIGGKKYSLSSFGINTLGYFNSDVNEKYAYHIDGDEDDAATSAKKDKLRAAIEDDPEAVTDFLKQLTDGLYKDLDKQMKSTTMRSAYTIYNDKEMAKEYSSYNKLIKTWEDRISSMEESYFKKFTAMEKALSTMQSNSTALSGLLGG
ncbi:MAG: flagellar filament capping protein FliD [Lachnospiraceae bacterium]|nr:flagellar filament capping protein FliD [Lachnospiraceae bacterium]